MLSTGPTPSSLYVIYRIQFYIALLSNFLNQIKENQFSLKKTNDLPKWLKFEPNKLNEWLIKILIDRVGEVLFIYSAVLKKRDVEEKIKIKSQMKAH